MDEIRLGDSMDDDEIRLMNALLGNGRADIATDDIPQAMQVTFIQCPAPNVCGHPENHNAHFTEYGARLVPGRYEGEPFLFVIE